MSEELLDQELLMSQERPTQLHGQDDVADPSVVVPAEIMARGTRAKQAYENALRFGKVKVYHARIILIGQDRAGKTSLKKSLLGLPFDPEEQSTVGIEEDPSLNWQSTDNKGGDSQVVEELAKMAAGELEKEETWMDVKTQDEPNEKRSDRTRFDSVEHLESQVKIDPSVPPEEFTQYLIQYLKGSDLQNDSSSTEPVVEIDLWDFAGQHLYNAYHLGFFSQQALYLLVYDLSKGLNNKAEPYVRQGIHDVRLENPKEATNLDNLLSWLVSVSAISPTKGGFLEKEISYVLPPVFIVGTHADKPFQDIEEMRLQIMKELVRKDYERHVFQFFSVDNTQSSSDAGVSELRKAILEVLKLAPYMGEEIPVRWFRFEKLIQALVAKNTFYLNIKELQTIVQEVCFVDGEDEVGVMLNYYHDLGLIEKHGSTVVLQAQWLIGLFKQLITIPRYKDMGHELKHIINWKYLQKEGVLRMELVRHVFSKFIKEDSVAEKDILDMMERFGLIVKFATSTREGTNYFVPAQLRSLPKMLCEMNPSPSDPCPLYLDFLNGFVPHGIFYQLVSRCIRWCSENGYKRPPDLYDHGARFFVEKQFSHQLILLCKKRYIKIVLKHRKSVNEACLTEAEEVACDVRSFLEGTLEDLSRQLPWRSNLKYEVRVECPFCRTEGNTCQNHSQISCTHEDCVCLLTMAPTEELTCEKSFSDETPTILGLEQWFSRIGLQDDRKGKTGNSCHGDEDSKEVSAKHILQDLRQMQDDAGRVTKQTNLILQDLRKIASDKGFRVSDNQGSGNCMFYALSEQLQSVLGIRIQHEEVRNTLVQFLKKNPHLPDGTDLFCFVDGYQSWDDYLTKMEQDGTWGDHVILRAAANCFETCIHVVSSLPHGNDVIIRPDCRVVNKKPLVLGHVNEIHYVSLQSIGLSEKRRLESESSVGQEEDCAKRLKTDGVFDSEMEPKTKETHQGTAVETKDKQGLEYYKQRLRTAQDEGDIRAEGEAYCGIATIYYQRADYKQAIECLKQCLSIAMEIGDRFEEGWVYKDLCDSYEKLGDYEQVMKYHKLYLDVANEEEAEIVEEGQAHKPFSEQAGKLKIEQTRGEVEAEKAAEERVPHDILAKQVFISDNDDVVLDDDDDDDDNDDDGHDHDEEEVDKTEDPNKIKIHEETVTSDGTHWYLKQGAAHMFFPRNAVSEPTLIVVHRWKSRARSPKLQEHEAVISNVIEISTDRQEALNFKAYVTMVISHSAPNLHGYELVVLKLTETESDVWEEVAGIKDLWEISDLQDEYPSAQDVSDIQFPAVEVDITECSTYAVICRLKSSPPYTITCEGGYFNLPDYPSVSVTIPENAVAPSAQISLHLKVQEVPGEEFEGKYILFGPILRILCTEAVAFLKPVTIQLPVALGDKQHDIPDSSACLVRVTVLRSDNEHNEWIEITDHLKNPPCFDGRIVNFQVEHFSRFMIILQWCRRNIIDKVFEHLRRFVKPPQLGSFLAYCDSQRCTRSGAYILYVICCPSHKSKSLRDELSKKFTVHHTDSIEKMIPGRDKAYIKPVSVIMVDKERPVKTLVLQFDDEECTIQLAIRPPEKKIPKIDFYRSPTFEQETMLASLLFTCPPSKPESSPDDYHHPTSSPDIQVKQCNPTDKELEELGLEIRVKQGTPTKDELEELGFEIANDWMVLGRRLEVNDPRLQDIHQAYEQLREKGYQMLIRWKQEKGSAATYQVLSDALQHKLVQRQDLAKQFCYIDGHSGKTRCQDESEFLCQGEESRAERTKRD